MLAGGYSRVMERIPAAAVDVLTRALWYLPMLSILVFIVAMDLRSAG
ncbi:hypothetical protein GCM10020369_07900 [Cryptosporangium minutisporangium]|uniref:ABC transporter permease n=1 Tax=Cryptosporangium minutisporangium TaxID=113569 RepID=A0ABP6SRS1_9ACTN